MTKLNQPELTVLKLVLFLTVFLHGLYVFCAPGKGSDDGRFMIGLKGGLTANQPVILRKFNIISPLNSTVSQSGIKTYNPFYNNLGYQYAFTALYTLNKSFDIRIEPTFSTCVYRYNTDYAWESSAGNYEMIKMAVKHKQTLKYIEVPVTLRYLYGSGTIRPFIQGGISYSYLLNAFKSFKRNDTYVNDLGNTVLTNETVNGDASKQYLASKFAINAGIGIDCDLNVVHITADINLNAGLNSPINRANRFSSQQYSGGIYDVQDNLRLLMPSVNIGLLFPIHKPARSAAKCPVNQGLKK